MGKKNEDKKDDLDERAGYGSRYWATLGQLGGEEFTEEVEKKVKGIRTRVGFNFIRSTIRYGLEKTVKSFDEMSGILIDLKISSSEEDSQNFLENACGVHLYYGKGTLEIGLTYFPTEEGKERKIDEVRIKDNYSWR